MKFAESSNRSSGYWNLNTSIVLVDSSMSEVIASASLWASHQLSITVHTQGFLIPLFFHEETCENC